tara:strand:- start:1910 stop:2302 length:393 start_codon:yes stop_codon:yes gene_type:complete
MLFYKSILLTAVVTGLSTPVFADVVEGVWRSKPDQNGLVIHVRAKPCGTALCGTVERAKDRNGYEKRSSAVGKRVFWDMKPQADGSYVGTFLEPSASKKHIATILVNGNAMMLHKCADGQCDEIIWTRLR